jgi:uncharacterized protein (TIGR03435 family)
MRAEPPLKFETAVIKPSEAYSTGVWLIPEPDGSFRAQNAAVWQLIEIAYYIRDQQLTGGPAWVKTDRYDITAKPEEAELTPPRTTKGPALFADHLARNRQWMQALLRDRFGLVLQTETKVQPFYSLRVAPAGNKMEIVSDHGDPIARMRTGSLAVSTDIKGIAALLTDLTGRLVVDETGLTGLFKARLEWKSDDAIFSALEEQLGLQLEAKTGPVPVFVIKEIQRPSED